MSNLSSSEKPLVKIIPPIQQPTDFDLILILFHMICMTIGLCGNISQISIQIYAGRFRKKSHVQFFLAIFFFLNAFISLGAPWSMLEIVSRQWSFTRAPCQFYEITNQVAKTLLPYTIAAIYAITTISLRPNPHQSIVSMVFSLIFVLLTLLIVARVAQSAQLESHYLGQAIQGEENTVIFEVYKCVVPFRTEVYTPGLAAIVEIGAPLTICLLFAIRLKGAFKLRHLAAITILHFTANCWWYILALADGEGDRSSVVGGLSYLSASLVWIPAALFSELWANYETRASSPLSDDVFLPSTMRSTRLFTNS